MPCRADESRLDDLHYDDGHGSPEQNLRQLGGVDMEVDENRKQQRVCNCCNCCTQDVFLVEEFNKAINAKYYRN